MLGANRGFRLWVPRMLSLAMVVGFQGVAPAPTIHLRIALAAPPSGVVGGSLLAPNEAWVGLKHTVDGGRTWRAPAMTRAAKVALGLDPSTNRGLLYDELLAHTYFSSPDHGWLNVMYGSRHSVWQTTDGARTWARVLDSTYAAIAFADEIHGWMAIPRNGAQQNLTTSDGGKSWQDCNSTFLPNGSMGKAFFFDKNHGWASWSAKNGDHFIYGVSRTSDGGCTWSNLWQTAEVLDAVSEIRFADDKHGWLVNMAPPKVLYTTDGGASWTHLALPPEADSIESAFFASPSRVWILTTRERVYQTDSGGLACSETSVAAAAAQAPAWASLRLLQIVRGGNLGKNMLGSSGERAYAGLMRR